MAARCAPLMALLIWLFAGALWALAVFPSFAQSSPDEQGGTPLLQGGVSTNSYSGDASSGQDSGGDIFNTTTGDPNNSPPPPVDPGSDPNAPPVIPGNVTGNNNNQPGGGGYWAPPPHVPCGMNQLEAQAWGGGSPAGGFLSALGTIIDPYCRETFNTQPRPRQQPRPASNSNGCWRGLPDGKLCVDGKFFKNGRGQIVILRGVNLAGTSKIPPFLPLPLPSSPMAPGEFDTEEPTFNFLANTNISALDPLPGWGVNVIRLLFVWEAYEPADGVRRDAYLQMLERIAREAWKRGIYTIIDFHQDAFARWLAWGCGEGFPLWGLRLALGLPKTATFAAPSNKPGQCTNWMVQAFADPNASRAFDGLYANGELRRRYVELMKTLATRFRMVPGVIGYDVLNEPFSQLSDPASGRAFNSLNLGDLNDQQKIWHEKQLTDFYQAVYGAIRPLDPSAILFLEPNLLVDRGIQTDLGTPCNGASPSCNVAYAPHYYDNSITAPIWPNYTSPNGTRQAFRNMSTLASRWGTPLFIGEFGAVASVKNVDKYMDEIHDDLNATFASAAQWSYTPGWTEQAKDGWNGEDLSIATDGRGTYRPQLFIPRPYPQSIGGWPISLKVHATQSSFSLSLIWQGDPVANQTVIYLPQLPQLQGGQAQVVAVGGGPVQTQGPVQCSLVTTNLVRLVCITQQPGIGVAASIRVNE
jgi:endoglycosylceramidase